MSDLPTDFIFKEGNTKWGGFEELVLLDAIQSHGYENWGIIAEDINLECGSNDFKVEEVATHYDEIYVDGPFGDAVWFSKLIQNTKCLIYDHTPPDDDVYIDMKDESAAKNLTHEQLKQIGYMPLRGDFEKIEEHEISTLMAEIEIRDEYFPIEHRYAEEYDPNDAALVKDLMVTAIDVYCRDLREKELVKQLAMHHKLPELYFKLYKPKKKGRKRSYIRSAATIYDSIRRFIRFLNFEEVEQMCEDFKTEMTLRNEIKCIFKGVENENLIFKIDLPEVMETADDDPQESRSDTSKDFSSDKDGSEEGEKEEGNSSSDDSYDSESSDYETTSPWHTGDEEDLSEKSHSSEVNWDEPSTSRKGFEGSYSDKSASEEDEMDEGDIGEDQISGGCVKREHSSEPSTSRKCFKEIYSDESISDESNMDDDEVREEQTSDGHTAESFHTEPSATSKGFKAILSNKPSSDASRMDDDEDCKGELSDVHDHNLEPSASIKDSKEIYSDMCTSEDSILNEDKGRISQDHTAQSHHPDQSTSSKGFKDIYREMSTPDKIQIDRDEACKDNISDNYNEQEQNFGDPPKSCNNFVLEDRSCAKQYPDHSREYPVKRNYSHIYSSEGSSSEQDSSEGETFYVQEDNDVELMTGITKQYELLSTKKRPIGKLKQFSKIDSSGMQEQFIVLVDKFGKNARHFKLLKDVSTAKGLEFSLKPICEVSGRTKELSSFLPPLFGCREARINNTENIYSSILEDGNDADDEETMEHKVEITKQFNDAGLEMKVFVGRTSPKNSKLERFKEDGAVQTKKKKVDDTECMGSLGDRKENIKSDTETFDIGAVSGDGDVSHNKEWCMEQREDMKMVYREEPSHPVARNQSVFRRKTRRRKWGRRYTKMGFGRRKVAAQLHCYDDILDNESKLGDKIEKDKNVCKDRFSKKSESDVTDFCKDTAFENPCGRGEYDEKRYISSHEEKVSIIPTSNIKIETLEAAFEEKASTSKENDGDVIQEECNFLESNETKSEVTSETNVEGMGSVPDTKASTSKGYGGVIEKGECSKYLDSSETGDDSDDDDDVRYQISDKFSAVEMDEDTGMEDDDESGSEDDANWRTEEESHSGGESDGGEESENEDSLEEEIDKEGVIVSPADSDVCHESDNAAVRTEPDDDGDVGETGSDEFSSSVGSWETDVSSSEGEEGTVEDELQRAKREDEESDKYLEDMFNLINIETDDEEDHLYLEDCKGFDLLSEEEQELCASLELRPVYYLAYRTVLISADDDKQSGLPIDSFNLFPTGLEPSQCGQIADFLLERGWIETEDLLGLKESSR